MIPPNFAPSAATEYNTGTAALEPYSTHAIDAPRELVSRAWTGAERLAQWWVQKISHLMSPVDPDGSGRAGLGEAAAKY